MNYLFLGRNTVQWLTLAGVVIGLLIAGFPGLGDTAKEVLAFLTALDAGAVLWITQTSVTPITDPRLAAGTVITVLDPQSGAITGTSRALEAVTAPPTG